MDAIREADAGTKIGARREARFNSRSAPAPKNIVSQGREEPGNTS